MNESELNNNLFGLFKSEKRIKILENLIKSDKKLNFNKISKDLEIKPSNLEYHLKQLEDQGIITHVNNKYGINAYSKIIWNNLQNLRHLEPSLSFLKTHQLPIDDSDLLIELLTLEITYIPDSISLLTFMNHLKIKDLSKMNIVGLYNLELEEKLIKLVNYENKDIQITNTELIMDIDNYITLVSYDNFDYYFKMIDSGTLNVYICEKCNFFIGITKEFGILCLPDLANLMDYQQCLVFLKPKALSWLNKWYNQIKQKAKRIPFSKKVFKNKEDILEYLNSLKD